MTGNVGRSPALAWWTVAPRHLSLRPEDVAPPGPGEVHVRTLFSGISHGTEMLVYRGQVPGDLDLDLPTLSGRFGYPIKYGYACVGEVVTTGQEVTDLRPGSVVFAFHPHQTQFTIERDLLVPLESQLDAVHGVFLASLETAFNVMLDAPLLLGDVVVIFGAGVIGLLLVALATYRGAGRIVVVEPFPRRREVARRLGAHVVLGPGEDVADQVRGISGGRGADLALESSGNPDALQTALDSLAFQGTVVVSSWYGSKPATLDLGSRFHRQRLRVLSSQVSSIDPSLSRRWTRERRLAAVAGLLRRLPLERLISHRVRFAEADRGFDLIDRHPEETLQVVLEYPGAEHAVR